MNSDFYNKFNLINQNYALNKYPSPLQKINIFNQDVYIKRDDLLDLHCSKQRSIPFMILDYVNKGYKKFAISSSGNAALVASYIALKDNNVEILKIFLSNQISDRKIQKFIDLLELNINITEFKKGYKFKNIEFILAENPKQQAFLLGKQDYINLRGSTDDLAVWGFKSISYELNEQLENYDSIFIPSSSGATAIGIFQANQELRNNPQMNIVQTSKVHTLLKRVVNAPTIESTHISEAISDIVGHRRLEIENLISKTQGEGWIISEKEVFEAIDILKDNCIETTPDSALAFAAYIKSIKTKKYNKPVLVFTG